ncbi:hypothetical protein BLNAU_10049 [Blattamonas nauphoetae]|uniref:Uncharacterized protein n=1 Tax=Blattamonas nauphoetae TaxID=2049346 RepID=A0ABQ9XTW1_9EUKA|nr:hypothetical protein BLNAU_10049 [Blattamonas nauphoetae]
MTTDQIAELKDDSFSLTRRCGFALAQIEKAVLTLGHSLGRRSDEKSRHLQEKVGGVILRHFSSSLQSPSEKEIGSIGTDLAAVRREMDDKMRQMEMQEKEREMAASKAEKERQKEFARKMREMEEMKRMNEKWIEEGRQREEEKKREEERKRKEEEEEEERRRNVKEGAAAIEAFQQDKFTLVGNVFTMKESYTYHHLLSHSFGAVVVRITFIIRAVNTSLMFGLISTNLTEQAKTGQEYFLNLKGGAGWNCQLSNRCSRQNFKSSHRGSACKAGAVGQRVVLEADGREGKRTLKLSQDGETQPVFFTNIPVPFRFAHFLWWEGNSVEIVSSEVLSEPSFVGGSYPVVVD